MGFGGIGFGGVYSDDTLEEKLEPGYDKKPVGDQLDFITCKMPESVKQSTWFGNYSTICDFCSNCSKFLLLNLTNFLL